MAKVGRPLKYTNVEELQSNIDKYFIDMDSQGRPYTVSGLALYLDTSRDLLLRYTKTDEFHDTIKKAKLKIENYAEEQLYTSRQVAGVIFNLKNNYGWVDKQEIATTNININQELETLSKLTDEEINQIELIIEKADKIGN